MSKPRSLSVLYVPSSSVTLNAPAIAFEGQID